MRHKEFNAILASAQARKAARQAKRDRDGRSGTDKSQASPHPVITVDAEVVSATDSGQEHLGRQPSEIEGLLLHHARTHQGSPRRSLRSRANGLSSRARLRRSWCRVHWRWCPRSTAFVLGLSAKQCV